MFKIVIEAEIFSLLVQVKAAYPSIKSIWLIGSRANGCAINNSDWDFLVFANQETLELLRCAIGFHRANIDFLVVEKWRRF